MTRIPIIENREKIHRIVFFSLILCILSIILFRSKNLINDNITGILVVGCIVTFFVLITTIKNYSKIGYLLLASDEISVFTNEEKLLQKFQIAKIQRLRLIFNSIRGDISNSRMRGLAAFGIFQVQEGINRIEIINIEGQLTQFKIVISSEYTVDLLEREFLAISNRFKDKIEILKE